MHTLEPLIYEIAVPSQEEQRQVYKPGPSDLIQTISFLLDDLMFLPDLIQNKLRLVLKFRLFLPLLELLLGPCQIQPPLGFGSDLHLLLFQRLHLGVMTDHSQEIFSDEVPLGIVFLSPLLKDVICRND